MNIHIITGPNGMCRCGEDGKTCSEILNHETDSLRTRVLALEAQVSELREALTKVKRGLCYPDEYVQVADAALSSQPDLPLIEEVREVLENVRGFEVIGERCRKRIDSILARLNPAKL